MVIFQGLFRACSVELFLFKFADTRKNWIVFCLSQIWDIRTDGVVRTVRGPFVCGDGLDILGDEILTGSWVAHHSLQVCIPLQFIFCSQCLQLTIIYFMASPLSLKQ